MMKHSDLWNKFDYKAGTIAMGVSLNPGVPGLLNNCNCDGVV